MSRETPLACCGARALLLNVVLPPHRRVRRVQQLRDVLRRAAIHLLEKLLHRRQRALELVLPIRPALRLRLRLTRDLLELALELIDLRL